MKTQRLTEEQLNSFPKEAIAALYLQLIDMVETLTVQNQQLIERIDSLEESLRLSRMQQFGRKTEKTETFSGQLRFDFENNCILNEAEDLLPDPAPEEPAAEEAVPKRKKASKQKGKRKADLSGVPVAVEDHVIPAPQLEKMFPGGYDELPDEVFSVLEYHPGTFELVEHHVHVYASREDRTVIKAERPSRLFTHSIISPSLAAAVLNAKYVNAVPLTRFSKEMERQYDIRISRQVLAGWMIRLSERYFSMIFDAMHQELLKSRLIHCDESPFKVIHDGRTPNAKSYMWVYHAHELYGSHPVYLYKYSATRRSKNALDFLRGYNGHLLTDGFEGYHKLARECPEITVAGCWAHAKRRFANLCKAMGPKDSRGSIAEEANSRIAAIFHLDNMYKDASPEERLKNRKESIGPLVDAFFAWLKEVILRIDKNGETGKAVGYCIRQEQFLREFLNDGIIPLDNNDAERSIRAFCVGRSNWHVIDSPNGAEASGVLYSIAETAKANKLRPYFYFRYVLEEMAKHQEDTNLDFIQDLLPWSDKLPDECRMQKPKNN